MPVGFKLERKVYGAFGTNINYFPIVHFISLARPQAFRGDAFFSDINNAIWVL